MKIVFLDARTVGELPNLDELKTLGDITFYETTSPSQTSERIEGADVVITNKVILDRELIEQSPNLKLICIAATGMNNVDLEAAEKAGVEVKNVSGYAAKSVAQATFAMLLNLMHQIPYYDRYVKDGSYSKSDIFTHLDRPFHELHGKRLGIIGLGTIGRATAAIAEAFGAEVVYYSTSGQNNDQPYQQLSLDELLATSDVVSIHAPLNENTVGLIGEPELKRMKPSAFLVNTGRGGIVDEPALAEAIDAGEIAGAALDVFETEPLPAESPLLKVKQSDRLILVPHIAWSSVEARTELMEGVIGNIHEFKKRTQR